VKKRLITADSSEESPEDITCTELSDDDYTALFESEMAYVIRKMEESYIYKMYVFTFNLIYLRCIQLAFLQLFLLV
jgi:hypothetical protein